MCDLNIINLRHCEPVMRANIIRESLADELLGDGYHPDRKRTHYLYIGRPGKLGNPIRVGSECIVCGSKHAKGETLPCYEVWARNEMSTNPAFEAAVWDIGDRTLACWCEPDKCHGSILIKLWREGWDKHYESFLCEIETTDEHGISNLEGRV